MRIQKNRRELFDKTIDLSFRKFDKKIEKLRKKVDMKN